MVRSPLSLARTLVPLCAVLAGRPAAAQTPFPLYDPFYFNETAGFGYDAAYAVSGDVALRPTVADDDATALVPDPFALAVRLDLRLGRALDVGGVIDVSSEGVGRTLQWSWATARYAWTTDTGAQQAFRLAVDPSADASVGFPLVDFAFLSSGAPTGRFATQFGIGVRRVQRGYQRFVPVTVSGAPSTDFDVHFERAFGWELRAVVGGAYVFDAAGSRAYATLTGLRGVYDLQTVATAAGTPPPAARAVESTGVWVQAGVSFDRPSVRFAPYARLPVFASRHPDLLPPAAAFGVQLTLR